MIIVEYPDPILATRCDDVVVFDAAHQSLVASMAEAMYAAHGVGLAAPQVNRLQRILLIDPSGGVEANHLVPMNNPRVIWRSPEVELAEEGCLSMPGVTLHIQRSVAIDVEYHDMAGLRQQMRCTGFKARIVQHEVDHLDGIVMVDRLGYLARKLAMRDLGKKHGTVKS
jgi:peptide deformylase